METKHDNMDSNIGTVDLTADAEPLLCTKCEKVFMNPNYLKRHTNTYHPEHEDRQVKERMIIIMSKYMMKSVKC